MGINIDYSASPGAVLNAAYMAGKNKYAREEQAAMLPFVRDRQQFQRQAYLSNLAWQHQQQLAYQQMVPVGPRDVPNGHPKHNVQINAQHRANDRARRQGHAIPFPDVEAGQPIPARIVQEGQRQAGALRREQGRENAANQRNQANIDAANRRAAGVQEGEDRRAKAKQPQDFGPDPLLPAAPGELGPRGGGTVIPGKPFDDPSRDKTSMIDPAGYLGGQSLASTGLVGSAPSGTPDFMGQYQQVMASLNQQLAQMPPQQSNDSPVTDSPYLQGPTPQNQIDQSAYYG